MNRIDSGYNPISGGRFPEKLHVGYPVNKQEEKGLFKQLSDALSGFWDCFEFVSYTESKSPLLSDNAHSWFMDIGYMELQMGGYDDPEYKEVKAVFDQIETVYKNHVKPNVNPRQMFLAKGDRSYRVNENFLSICQKNDFSAVHGTQKVGLRAVLGIACTGSYKTYTGPLTEDFNNRDMDASPHGPNFIVFKDVEKTDDENIYYSPKEVEYFLVQDKKTKTKLENMFNEAKANGLMTDELLMDNLNKLKTYEELNRMLFQADGQ